jgi:hypothetical protein
MLQGHYPTTIFIQMKTTILKFNSLADLAKCFMIINPNAYLINTPALTLSATLSSFELAVALEQYGAILLQESVMV